MGKKKSRRRDRGDVEQLRELEARHGRHGRRAAASFPPAAAESAGETPYPKAEIIEIGVFGTVAWFSNGRGFGFIKRDDPKLTDVFVHQTALPDYIEELEKGQRVSFDVKKTPRGMRAENVQMIVPENIRGVA